MRLSIDLAFKWLPTIAVIASGSWCLAIKAQELYMVGGWSDMHSEQYATVIYRFEEGGLKPFKTLFTEKEGSLHININYEARRLVAMSNPNVPPGRSRLLIVDFDQPDAIASLPLGETYSVVESGFLNIPGSGYYYSLTRGEMEPPRQVDFAVRLSASDFELKPISAKLLRYRESSGLAGFETEEFMVGYAADTGLVTTGRLSDGTTQLLPPIPTDIRPNGRWVRIGARNRFMTVLHLPGGKVLLYSDRTGWFCPPSLQEGIFGPARVIGPWVALKLAKPEAMKSPKDRKQAKFDVDLNDPKNWVTHVKTGKNDRTSEKRLNDTFTGTIKLFNIETGQDLTLQTSDANNDVLWIDNSQVYYRVNDTLYRSEITQQGLGVAKIVAKAEALWDVHWAFWSK